LIEQIFNNSRLLVVVTIVVSSLAAVMLYIVSIHVVFHIVIDFVSLVPSSADGGKRLAVKLLKVLDTLLIAVTFQIIAVSLYRLFIITDATQKSEFLRALSINNFHDLKITLIQVAMVILVIQFLEQAVEIGASVDTLYFGLAIAAVIAAGVWATKSMSHDDDHHHDE